MKRQPNNGTPYICRLGLGSLYRLGLGSLTFIFHTPNFNSDYEDYHTRITHTFPVFHLGKWWWKKKHHCGVGIVVVICVGRGPEGPPSPPQELVQGGRWPPKF